MRFGRIVCALIGSMLIGLPASAQEQTAPPPPPPTEGQAAPTTPPPFPPMPKREPRHRWVDMGSGRTSHAHQKAAPRHHKAASHKAASHKTSHKKSRAEDQAKKDLRWCKSLSHRQLSHNKRCERILAKDKKARVADKPTGRELRRCKGLSSHRRSHDKACRKLVSRDEKQHRTKPDHASCKSLGYRELVHNEACRKRLDRDARAAAGEKHKSSSHHRSTRHGSKHRKR